jgi:L,D-transpeptidase catalytic domain
VAAAALLGLASWAGASSSSAQTPPPAQPSPQPQSGRASIAVRGGLATRRARYVARGQRVVVVGRVRPYVEGQIVSLAIVRRGRVISRLRARIGPTPRGGRFVFRFRARRRGTLRLVARHAATPQQAAFRARDRLVRVVRWSAGGGARGTRVVLLQRGLRALGYPAPLSGHYGGSTSRAVLAFRKVNSLGRSGRASVGVYERVLRRRGRFRLRHPRAGKHAEFDWSRQVLALARGGRVWRVYHASSGKASTPTVFGSFRFYRKQPGTNSHGMLHSNYFIGGYAIHGYPSVPNYPASHGCIRVPNANARAIDAWIRLGDRIFVYR